MNLVLYALSVLGFWVCGFALLSGGRSLDGEGSISLFGHPLRADGASRVFPAAAPPRTRVCSAAFSFRRRWWLLRPLIPAGVMAERWRFGSVIPYGFWSAALPIALFGNWVWGGGWLAQLGQNLGIGPRFCRFCRFLRHPHGRRRGGLMGAMAPGSALGQIQPGWPSPAHARVIIWSASSRNVAPGGRLVRFQPSDRRCSRLQRARRSSPSIPCWPAPPARWPLTRW